MIVLVCSLLAVAAAHSSSRVEGIPDGHSGIPQEIARMFASALSPDGVEGDLLARIGHVQSSLAEIQTGDMGEQKMLEIRKVVKAMFTEESANLTKVQEWKESMRDTPYAQSLLELIESTHTLSQAAGEDDPPSLVQASGEDGGDEITLRKPTLSDVRNGAMKVASVVGNKVRKLGQMLATRGASLEAIGAGQKSPDWRVIALLNPNLLCFFTDMSFLPCVAFDICMGIAMEVTTLPTWWAKESWQLATIPGNIYGSMKSMSTALNICSVVNLIVATQMPPVTDRLKDVKGRVNFRKNRIKEKISKVGGSLKSLIAKIGDKVKKKDADE